MTVLPQGREWTIEDLALTPDDGLRYELVDGVLLVSGAPTVRHQVVSGELFVRLRAAAPNDCVVLYAPVAFQPTRRRLFQPDLVVIRRADLRPGHVEALVLAVEVLSPSTRSVDLLLKRGVYAESDVSGYWVVDPDVPSVQAWTLVNGAWVDAGCAEGDQTMTVREPFAIELVPADLLAGT